MKRVVRQQLEGRTLRVRGVVACLHEKQSAGVDSRDAGCDPFAADIEEQQPQPLAFVRVLDEQGVELSDRWIAFDRRSRFVFPPRSLEPQRVTARRSDV